MNKICLVKIHKSPISGDYVQNNFDLEKFDTIEKAEMVIDRLKAVPLDGVLLKECGIEDIRGNVINERGRLYGFVDGNDNPQYFSLTEMVEENRNAFLKKDED